jgi:hypothetical protein
MTGKKSLSEQVQPVGNIGGHTEQLLPCRFTCKLGGMKKGGEQNRRCLQGHVVQVVGTISHQR